MKSWAEVNKTRKEERKKWKEEKLLKKAKKAELLEQSEASEANSAANKVHKLSTVSIAVPGSILDNAQSQELRTYLAGQIARAACIYQVDEVIVYDDKSGHTNNELGFRNIKSEEADEGVPKCCIQLARILQYLECPQYLRKHFFPIHNDLKFIGLVNPLDAPSHLRVNDNFKFREGIVTNKPTKPGKGSIVNVGLYREVVIDKNLEPGLRVTVKLNEEQSGKKLKGTVVPLSTPRAETGVFWGYTVRLASSVSQIITKCPYKNGYDVTIGTSDKGTNIDDVEDQIKYKHVLIVFGGLQGLEPALENDDLLNINDPALLFDHYLNTIPNQGSRTVRTEEAILISLATLRTKITAKYKPKQIDNFFQLIEKNTNTNSGS